MYKVITEDGEEISASEFDDDEFSLTFNSNGTGVSISEGEFRINFNWSISGNTIKLIMEGEEFYVTLDGSTIIVPDDGNYMYFRK